MINKPRPSEILLQTIATLGWAKFLRMLIFTTITWSLALYGAICVIKFMWEHAP